MRHDERGTIPGPQDGMLPDEAAGLRLLRPPHLRALTSLEAGGIPFLVLRLPVQGAGRIGDLDLLIEANSLTRAGQILCEAGFYPKTSPLGLPSKVVFTTLDGNRFYSLDIHTSVIARGLVYLDARALLRRGVVRNGCRLPSLEDSLLHLTLHALLGKREIGGKYAARIREFALQPLDREYMNRHLARFGLHAVFEELLGGVLDTSSPSPERLWRRARRVLLLRDPSNLIRYARYRLSGTVRVRRRAALVAFVGVDGVGKSTLVSAVQQRLSANGLRTESVYMGCWGRYQTRAGWVSGYSPRDRASDEERLPGRVLRMLKNLIKFGLFYGAIVYEQWTRYRRGVVRSYAHLILSDRFLYDLEIPFSRRYVRAGERVRRWIYRWFPAPDLIFHLQGEPHEIIARKDELAEEQIRRFEGIYRKVLSNRPVVRLQVNAPPDVLASRIIEEHWRDFLQACWKRAPCNVLRSFRCRNVGSRVNEAGTMP